MIIDFVIDTCTLMHADNPEDKKLQIDSIRVINYLIEASQKICVDEGFNFENESKNRSYIGHEYIKHLHQGMLGYALIADFASIGRIDIISSKTNSQINDKVIRCVPKNKGDRIFLKVAYNSKSKIFISHDFDDFDSFIREKIKSLLKVKVIIGEDFL